ncbi:MAG: cation-translocating P-type ATPase [Planctomycetales bacterium]|nr:cation-translocating P-type ATPase [Planctomycetales bacterium]
MNDKSRNPAPDSCDYCGLPLPRAWVESPQTQGEQKAGYCCLGCQFAAAVTAERGEEGAVRWTMTRLGLGVFFTLNVVVFSMALWSQDMYPRERAEPAAAMADAMYNLFRYAAMTFALPVPFLLAGPLVVSAWRHLRRGLLSTDLLLVAGVAAAFAYSIGSVIAGGGHIYFEVGCVILVMVTLGRWLEAAGRLRTTRSLTELEELLPETVTVVQNGMESVRSLHDVRPGDTLRVAAGQRIATDGVIARNRASVDEQMLTGESTPITKGPGDEVLAGTLNLDGDLYVVASRGPEQSAMQRLIDCIRDARLSGGHFQTLADRAATWFAPLIAVTSVITFVWHAVESDVAAGIMTSLAVVLIACPCALGIATPLAVWTALSRAARAQVLFRSGDAIERLARVRALRLDKTGTLTTGTARVARFIPLGEGVDDSESRAMIEQVARALADTSSHAFSSAIVRSIGPGRACLHVTDSRTQPGRGVAGFVTAIDTTAFLGSLDYLESAGIDMDEVPKEVTSATAAGESLVAVGWSGQLRGVFTLAEQLRSEATDAIAACQQMGLDVGVLTGDHRRRGDVLAQQLGVQVDAALLPEDKLAAITEARRTVGPVAMVGDGVNDAPALAAADVGVAMGCGADVTRESASVCLLGNNLLRLPWSIDLAERTVRVIRLNLVWAFAYNAVGVGLAAVGLLNPIVASFAMVASSGLVVANSLRLRRVVLVGENTLGEPRRLEASADSALNDASAQTDNANRAVCSTGRG